MLLPKNSAIAVQPSREKDILLSGSASGIYLEGYPRIQYRDYASVGANSHKNEVNEVNEEISFNLSIPALGRGIAATVKVCAAWAVLLVSHGCTAKLHMLASESEEFIDTLNLAVEWSSCVGDLIFQVQAKLEDSFQGTYRDDKSKPRRERESKVTFFLSITPGEPDREEILLKFHARNGKVYVGAGPGTSSRTALLRHLLDQYEYIVREICSPDNIEKPLVDLKAVSIQDLTQIWAWNARVPPRVNVCIHEIFMERARRHPDLLAISAHDGELTYRDLDYLSTRLANAIIQQGIQPHSIVMILIEKSMWVPVAQIAVMKCGCASTVLDASLAFQRHQSIAGLAQPSAILTSPGCAEQARGLALECPQFVLSYGSSRHWPNAGLGSLPTVNPSAWLYIVFTSGSTGTPKGAIISHANYASAVANQQNVLDIREFDRVFDFASYAFDAAWCNVIHALTVGGCLCIPSDDERKGDLVGALRKYQVNYAVLTPSVAWFRASDLPASLRTFHFGGEPLKAALVKELSTRSTVINAYGPAECSTVSTAIVAEPSDDNDPTIGTGLGTCTWIVKSDGSDLVPIGEIGELWLEGPIIGQGYLGDPEKTTATFVENPLWLTRGCLDSSSMKHSSGRQATLYRTGDLVRYRPNGSLEFVGRRDSQVKIRGQRVELGEIEHNLQYALTAEAKAENVQIIAEVIKPEGSEIPTLVSFLFMAISPGVSSADAKPILFRALEGIEDRLAELVPPYMIPSAFLPVENVPMTPTGKVDRRSLRLEGPKMYWLQLNTNTQSEQEENESELEANIRTVWSEILNLPLCQIRLDSKFTRLGGDSITAMQIVSRCRSQNISIRVADILKLQTVRQVAQSSKPVQEKVTWHGTEKEGIAWTLTPIQQIFFDNNPQGMNHYTLSYIVKLMRPTKDQELLAALLAITTRHSSLRARFRKRTDESTWEQYVAPAGSNSFLFKSHNFVDGPTMQLVVDERQAGMDLVNGPTFAVDVFNSSNEPQTLLMSAHHAVMDLVSWRIVWHELSQYLSGATSLPPIELSFQKWCEMQCEEGEKLDPAKVLPFTITPANFEYWGVAPGELFFRESTSHVSIVDAKTTALLLGASNDSFRSEILDILIGALVFCFSQVFPDRSPPPVFLEGHGREPVAGMNDFDLSEVIGWFTSIHPIELRTGPDSSVFDFIKLAKDIRRRVPGKGRPYFASRFYSVAGRKAFGPHKHVELIFNYRGSFQQLEDAKSIFKLEDRIDRNMVIPGDGSEYQRPSLIDMNLVIQEGQLQIWTRSHKHMRNHELVTRWVDSRYTLADFPLLDISYAGLDTLVAEQLMSEGIKETDVRDIYPCTPMQEGTLISSSIGAASYNSACVWQAVSKNSIVSVPRLRAAWETVSRMHPVFSTILSTHPETGRFIQVVLNDPNETILCQAANTETAVEHLQQMEIVKSLPSQPECFFTICSGQDGDIACRLDITHALMDALSLPIIVRDIEKAYVGQALSLTASLRDYIEYCQGTSAICRLSYWREYLAGVKPCVLPSDMKPSGSESRRSGLYGWLTLPTALTAPIAGICRQKGLTRSAFLHLAWSLVLSHLTGTREVCFGYISSGRDTPVDGIENIVGPLINMLISRIDTDRPISDVVTTIDRYHVEHLENQYVSLAEVQHEVSTDRLFNTNITVREARGRCGAVEESMHLVEVSEEDQHEYDMVLAATLNKGDTEVSIQYRTDFVSLANAQVIQATLQSAIEYLGSVWQQDTSAAVCEDSLYNAYFYHMVGTDETSALQQWEAHFSGIDASCHFPSPPKSPHRPGLDASVSSTIENVQWRDDCNIATQILASWALLQSSYGYSGDAVIGASSLGTEYGVISSRIPVPMPMRIKVDLNQSVISYIDSVQSIIQSWSKLPQLAMHRLRGLSAESGLACGFQTVVRIESAAAKADGQISTATSSAVPALSVRFIVEDTGLGLTAEYDEDAISTEGVTAFFSQFDGVLRQITSLVNSSSPLTEIDTISKEDLSVISDWNKTSYENVQGLVHELISRTVLAMPESPAISSWDGDLTYRQLDRLSTRLAHQLVHLGVGPEVIVPLYFEKSMWMPVSAVAVMKAGGAGVMIDCTQPIERASAIVRQVDAKVALVSKDNAERAAQFEGLQLLVVDKISVDALDDPEKGISLPQAVHPSNLVYVSFTSGSTGKPKGAMITHSCFSSAIQHQQRAHGFRAGQRVYDFASYAFDVSWSNLLHSLTSGSCLCIPSEYERSNMLLDSIRDHRATLINATPSILRHLDPKQLPDLEQILMGGEAWSEADFGDWIDHKRLMNSYGPGESTVKACINRAVRGMVPNTIGFGIGLNTWIVRNDSSGRLAPLGSVGELWLEGPQLARGYIGDDARTAASFVTRPKWTDSSGQACRFYRTGDLVRYEPGGALVFVGRKDSQVKIRGQRTELGEVECNIQKVLLADDVRAQVICDAFKPHKSNNPILVAFLRMEETDPWHKLAGLDERLAKLVPDYMVPTAYIALQEFPMTATGKINRRSLRETYARNTLEQLVALDAFCVSGHRAPSTASEKVLRDLWAEVLNIEPATISAEDSFLRIGGDSLGAMRLVSAARKRGIVLNFADIFKQRKLNLLAQIIDKQRPVLHVPGPTVEAFSLLDGKISPQEAKNQAAQLCHLEPADVEDVFPCTPLQAGLLAETVRRPNDNVLTETRLLKENVDIRRLRTAWQQVIRANPILRTRIVDIRQYGLVQVVIRYESCGIQEDGVTSTLDFGLGTPLVFYRISGLCFTWRIHHSLYDGWSIPIIFDSLTSAYQSEAIKVSPPFQDFIKYMKDCTQTEAATDFWKDQFSDFDADKFPVLPSPTYKPKCDKRLQLDIKDLASHGDYTPSTKIRLAWAILLSTISNSADASFGATVAGRQANVPGIEDMTGPTIATVPLRVAIDRKKTVRELLQQVQLQAAEMMPFEQVGIQQIRRISPNCNLGCQFQSLMVIQPEHRHQDTNNTLFECGPVKTEAADVNPFKLYAICLEVVLEPNNIRFCANYDSNIVPPTQFGRLADRFENILRQVSLPEVQAKPVSLLNTSSLGDLEKIWSWNDTILERSEQTVHEIFQQVASKQPAAPAVCSWDGDFTYGQLDEISTRIAHELLQAGLPQSGQRIVPLLFDKSKWTSVCSIAVMKANGTSLALDTTLPKGRLQIIVDLARPQIILTSAAQESRARELAPSTAQVIVVDDIQAHNIRLPNNPHLPAVDPGTWLYVVFTSGSTGIPKGAIISHSNFASALKYGQMALKFGPHSRTYDFVSYAFDVSWLNVLYTLCAGGCLCVPSQYEIQNEAKAAIARRRANTAFITPTVGKLLHGADLQVINYGGENLPRDEITYWKDRAQIIHSYGPSECTPISISHVLDPMRSRIIIGKGLGVRTWIVDPNHSNSLAAVGDIGELWLEGPLVGQGYVNNPEKSKASFLDDPAWLIQGGPGCSGRHGRTYRTGDLVRYEEDGSLEFIGRKDAQIKIRGQRVELEEIGHHILTAIGEATVSQVVVDIIKIADSTESVLVAFVELSQSNIVPGTQEARAYLQQLASTTRDRLSATIPSYMIPNAYMIVDSIPNTTSGKIDRGSLRRAAFSMQKGDLFQIDIIERRAPETVEERNLHALVAQILSWDGDAFGMNNNFIQLGGDSISAMRLASLARDKGIPLAVADILTKERIGDLLVTEQQAGLKYESRLSRFALLDVPDPTAFSEDEIMPQVQSGHGRLVDILPATDMQSTYLRDNLHQPRRSWFYSYIDFNHIRNEDLLIQSCEQLVGHCDIYRTAFVCSSNTFYQVVFDSWKPTIDIVDGGECIEDAFDKLLQEDVKMPASLGAPLVQFILIRGQSAKAKLVFSMSHAVYDAISFGQTLQTLSDIYNGLTPELNDFRRYVSHIQTSKADSYSHWRQTLYKSTMTMIPCNSIGSTQDGAPTVLDHSIPMPKPPFGITQASLFTLACASALGRLTGSTDVVFGRVVSGRAAVPDSLQKVVGPCLNRVPVRVQFTSGQTKTERLAVLQKQQAGSIAHETIGLSDIVQHCTDWPSDTKDFGCWVQYQNVDEKPVLNLPGAVNGLGSKQMWGIPVAANFLEIFAIPSQDTLTVRVIGGPGYTNSVKAELLDGVCSELTDSM
ncbi:hypothetical protein PENFLA_c007G00417 [Penicillium flavigenum]|uniref:Carrier domain-containing protein n=1 Tax=Penicillium flavigenum TaxID=254877 RepID=A0A1V6TJR2_9EURO|nr:hypothetical protein PENFLA_c007G00417 [Penicillium flavigenum]